MTEMFANEDRGRMASSPAQKSIGDMTLWEFWCWLWQSPADDGGSDGGYPGFGPCDKQANVDGDDG